jgi:acyl carrier protein
MSESFIEKVASMLGTLVESITTSNMLSFYGLDSIVAVDSVDILSAKFNQCPYRYL